VQPWEAFLKWLNAARETYEAETQGDWSREVMVPKKKRRQDWEKEDQSLKLQILIVLSSLPDTILSSASARQLTAA